MGMSLIRYSKSRIAFVRAPEVSPSLDRPVSSVANTPEKTFLCVALIKRLNAESATATSSAVKSFPLASHEEKRLSYEMKYPMFFWIDSTVSGSSSLSSGRYSSVQSFSFRYFTSLSERN